MSETQNISTMAEQLSADLFKWFKWKVSGSMNIDNECVIENHRKNTHPSDIVFNYYDPYSGKRIYLNCDLKSYSKDSISKKNFTDVLTSLAMSIECSEISEDWKENYLMSDVESYEITGLLFIFNHDNQSKKLLKDILQKIKLKSIPLRKGQRITVIGPEEISYFTNIVNDLKDMKSREIFKSFDDYTFFYPDLSLKKRHNSNNDEWNNPATIEYLTSPWMIVKYKNDRNNLDNYIIYYRGRGDSVDVFVYLIDTLSAYQLVTSENSVTVRLYQSHQKASIYFERAIEQYLQSWNMDSSRRDDLVNFKASSITNIISTEYNQYEIGMGIRGWDDE